MIRRPPISTLTDTIVPDTTRFRSVEGDLTVTGLLVVQPTGRVSGRIRYAEMELSRGARVRGDIDVLDDAALRRARGDGPKLAHDNSTLAGDGKSPNGGSPERLRKGRIPWTTRGQPPCCSPPH